MANFNETIAKALNNSKMFEAISQQVTDNYMMGLLTEDEMKMQIIDAKTSYGIPLTEDDLVYLNDFDKRNPL